MNDRTSSAASAYAAPFPTTTSGRSAVFSAVSAACTAAGSASVRGASATRGRCGAASSSAFPVMMSPGRSRYTGPGRPYIDVRTACSTKYGILSTRSTSAAYFTHGRAASTCGASWNAPIPCCAMSDDPPSRIIGQRFDHAFASPEIAFVIPGPDTTRHAPGRPVR